MARVIVVDDEPDVLQLVRIALESAGHEIVTAADVTEARAALASGPPPDLILLDWMLPDVPGTAWLRELRSDLRTRAIPVVMLTAKSLIADKEVAEALGATGYLVKPIRIDQLRSLVASMENQD